MKANLTNDLTKLIAWYLTHWPNKLVRFSHKNKFTLSSISGYKVTLVLYSGTNKYFIMV
jgi:hypothetical protein